MEAKEAIEILEYHQEWRLGKREEMIHKPKQLTEALDTVLAEFRSIKERLESQQLSQRELLLKYSSSKWNMYACRGEFEDDEAVNSFLEELNSHPEQLKDKTKEGRTCATGCDWPNCTLEGCVEGWIKA